MKNRKLLLGAALGAFALVATGAASVFYVAVHAEPGEPGGPPAMRLISADQYRNTVHQVFGDDVQVDASFPELQRQEGLVALGAVSATMTPSALDQFDRAARSVAAQALDPAHRVTLVSCRPRNPAGADTACATRFFTDVGQLLYRRPLTLAELKLQVGIADAAAQARGDFYEGLSYSLAGLLSSPKFLYITEVAEADPKHSGRYQLDAYSKASRLSLFLWNALPDAELLDAARRGELSSKHGLDAQVDRMLASPRLEDGVRGFFGDLLQLQDFEIVSKDPVIYPAFTFAASQDVHEQALRQITDHLLTRRGDYRDLFTTNHTFVSRELGPIYKTKVSSQAGDEWVPFTADKAQSAGVVTTLSFLASHSHPGRSSPTLRGRAIREIFLCQKLPDPPPTVNFTVFENLSSKLTARDRLKAHVTDQTCAGCHKMTDPLGLGFETYDGAGQPRTREHDALIDTKGEFDGKAFSGAADVGRALHDHPALTSCLTRRVYAYGAGRNPGPSDRRWLAWANRRFASSGYRLPGLLKQFAESRGFYAVSAPEAGEATVAELPPKTGG